DIVEGLVKEGLQELYAQGYQDDLEIFRSLEMRYLGQNYELDLPIAQDTLADGAADRIWQLFHEAHKARFGFNIPGEIIEIVNYSATVVSRTAKPEFHRLPAAHGPAEPIGRRAVHYL